MVDLDIGRDYKNVLTYSRDFLPIYMNYMYNSDKEHFILNFSERRNTASPRANVWGDMLSEQSADDRPSRTNSPGRDHESTPAPSLSEAASAFVKKEVDGEAAAAVVAPVEGLPPLVDLDDDIALLELDKYLQGDRTLQTSAASVKPDLKDMLVTPDGSKKASVQFNAEAEQVRN